MKSIKQVHEFSLFLPPDSYTKKNGLLIVKEPTLLHRLQHVLRIQVGELATFFTDTTVFKTCCLQIDKKTTQWSILQEQTTQPLLPKIHILLPLLKKESLESALYHIAASGVNIITLVKTSKSLSRIPSDKEYKRYKAVMQAAQEQARTYYHIDLQTTMLSLPQALELPLASFRLVADPNGTFLKNLLPPTLESCVIAVGPEADFTKEEYTLLQKHGFKTCTLGTTTLKAEQALTILTGIIRAWY